MTLINRDFSARTPEERDTLLAAVHGAVVPGGLFVLDCLSDCHYTQNGPYRVFAVSPGAGFWAPAAHIVLEERVAYPDERAHLDRTVVLSCDDAPNVPDPGSSHAAGSDPSSSDACGSEPFIGFLSRRFDASIT